MAVYMLNVAIIFISGLFYYMYSENFNKKSLLVITFMLLFSISALRFNIGLDYLNYTGTFKLANMTSGISGLLTLSKTSTVEIGYLILNRLVGLLTTQVQWIFVISSFITLSLVFYTIYKQSSMAWLSVYLFAVGGYVSSLNLVRQYIAIGILFFSYKYIKDRKIVGFLVCITIASLFHTSVLFFIPLYFILRINLNFIKISFSLIICLIAIIFFDTLFPFIQRIFYSDYIGTSYGMIKGNINNVIVAFIYFAFGIFYKKSLIQRNENNNILINWSFINLLFSIMSMKLWIITRIMEYSSIFLILLIPEIASSIKQKGIRVSFLVIIIIFTFILHVSILINPLNQLTPYKIFFN